MKRWIFRTVAGVALLCSALDGNAVGRLSLTGTDREAAHPVVAPAQTGGRPLCGRGFVDRDDLDGTCRTDSCKVTVDRLQSYGDPPRTVCVRNESSFRSHGYGVCPMEPEPTLFRPIVFDADEFLIPRNVMRRPPRDRRIHYGYAGWQRLVPTHSKIQYAGSIGIASAGFGWDYGRRGQWETDLLIGVIPSYNSDAPKLTLTLKGSYVPWSIGFGNRYSFEPFACGLFMSTILSEKFWVREPDRYPKGYYTFSTRIRSHVFVGQRFTCGVNYRRSDRQLRSISVYYELSTCDFYLISAITNRRLHVKDILSLSFGVKLQLFNPNEVHMGR